MEVTTGHYHDNINDEHNHSFDLNVDEVPEGWTRFHLTNGTNYDHFVLLYEVPQEAIDAAEEAKKTVLEHWIQTVTVPFWDEYTPYFNGKIDYGTFVDNLVGNISGKASWFFDPGAKTMGGAGITAAGYTSQTTVHLTEEREPRSMLDGTISSEDGIECQEAIRPGKQTVAIYFDDQTVCNHLLGHNVQLVRFENGCGQVLLNELEAWVDWSDPDGFIDTPPAGTTFPGGAMEMTAEVQPTPRFYTINLKPENHAWLAEVPDTSGRDDFTCTRPSYSFFHNLMAE